LAGFGAAVFRSAKNWWQDAESNRGHKDFQSSALPTELSCQPGPLIELGFAANGKTDFNDFTVSQSTPPSMSKVEEVPLVAEGFPLEFLRRDNIGS
jgi:hypothetical protein